MGELMVRKVGFDIYTPRKKIRSEPRWYYRQMLVLPTPRVNKLRKTTYRYYRQEPVLPMLGVTEEQGLSVLPVSASTNDAGRANQRMAPGTYTTDPSQYYR